MADFISDIKMLGVKTIIIDRGMTSIDNLNEFQNLKVQCIAGIRRNERLEKDYISKVSRDEIFSKKYMVKLKDTIVYAKSYEYMYGNLIVIYNPEIEVHQRNKLWSKENVTDKELAKMKYYGYSLIFHSTGYDTESVVKKYYEKDIIEKSFRQIKGVLSLHPLRLKLLNRISAHVKICYLSYCILSLLKYKLRNLQISPVDALDELSGAYKVYLEDSKTNFKWQKVVTLKKSQEKIMKAIDKNFCSV
jgi:transposase